MPHPQSGSQRRVNRPVPGVPTGVAARVSQQGRRSICGMEGGCRPTIPRARLGQVGIVMILSLSHRRQARGGRGWHCCRTKKCSAERCSKKSSVARTRAPHAASPRPAAACQPSPPPPPFRPSAPPLAARVQHPSRNARRSETLPGSSSDPAGTSIELALALLSPPGGS